MKYFTIIALICLLSCKDYESRKSNTSIKNSSKSETSERLIKNSKGEIYIAVIPKKQGFGTIPSTLSKNEIKKINEMLPRIVDKMIEEERKRREDFGENPIGKFNLLDYKRQNSPYINTKGEKEVFINCFCRVQDESWKTRIVTVDGGGSCYFMGVINLVTGEEKYFMTNAPM